MSKQVEKERKPMQKLPDTLRTEPLMTTSAVSKWLGVATRTICLWAECKEIPAIKVGRQWRFRESELATWLKSTSASDVKKGALLQAGATRF